MTLPETLSRLSDADLLHSLRRSTERTRAATADLLGHLAEADARKPQGDPEA